MLMKYRNTRSAVQNIAVGSSESSVEEFLVIPVIARHDKCPKTISLSLSLSCMEECFLDILISDINERLIDVTFLVHWYY